MNKQERPLSAKAQRRISQRLRQEAQEEQARKRKELAELALAEQYEAIRKLPVGVIQDNARREFRKALRRYANATQPLPDYYIAEFQHTIEEKAAEREAQEREVLRELPERVAALEKRIAALEQGTGTPERIAEVATLTERVNALEEREPETEMQELSAANSALEERIAALEQRETEPSVIEPPDETTSETPEQHDTTLLNARREYLAKLLYETPGAERERLAAAENKSLGELSAELDQLEKQLDAAE